MLISRKFVFFVFLALILAIPSMLIKGRLAGKLEAKNKNPEVISPLKQQTSKKPKRDYTRVGEKITYDIRMGNLKLGKATCRQVPSVNMDGRLLNAMVFETNLVRFKDTENIYSDPQTLLPVTIKRDILNWFKREEITEEYDQKSFTVTITKRSGKKTDKTVIKKDSPIHNAILLPHYVRNKAGIRLGYALTVNLPNRKFTIKLVSVENVKTPAGIFKAYHFKSSPKQIEIWISADRRRIPLKIQGVAGMGYLMVLKEYSFK